MSKTNGAKMVTKGAIEKMIRATIEASLVAGKDGATVTASGMSREGAWVAFPEGPLGRYELRAASYNKHVCQKYPSREISIREIGSAGKGLPYQGLHGAGFGAEYIGAVARTTAERINRGEPA
jgi:hypothetical protein